MDAFWTAAERAFRRAAREHFSRGNGPGATAAPEIPAGLGFGGWAALAEEAALHDPRSGRAPALLPGGSGPVGPAAEAVLACSRLAGTAAHVIEAGHRAAREQGAFASSLMGCREVQESLAGLVAGAELMRLGACRLCRLLDKGDAERAAAESARLLDGARSLAADVRAVAFSLLGAGWVAENLPEEEAASPDERTRP